MGKTPKLKKSGREASIHSRASRRATSPSINLDKSLKSVQPPTESRPVLAAHKGAGITKRKSKHKAISRSKRMRQDKGMEKAAAVMDKLEKKKDRSMTKEQVAKERRLNWDVVNESKILRGQQKKVDEEEQEWEDAEEEIMTDEEVSDGVTALKVSDPIPGKPTVDTGPGREEEEDEVL